MGARRFSASRAITADIELRSRATAAAAPRGAPRRGAASSAPRYGEPQNAQLPDPHRLRMTAERTWPRGSLHERLTDAFDRPATAKIDDRPVGP